MTATTGNNSSTPAVLHAGGLLLVAIGCVAASIALIHEPRLLAALAIIPGIWLLKQKNVPAAMFVFLIITNAPVNANKFSGVPFLVAASVPLLLLVPIFRHVVIEKQPIVLPRIIGLIVAFQLVQFLGILVATRPDEAAKAVFTGLTEGLAIMVLLVNAVRTRAELRACLVGAAIAAAGLSALTLWQNATGDHFNEYGGFAQASRRPHLEVMRERGETPRAGGPIGEKNGYAQILLITIPFPLLCLAGDGRKRTGWWILAFCLITAGVVMTGSRGGALGFFAMVVALFVIRRIPLRFLVGGIVLASVAISITAYDYFARLATIASAVQIQGEGVSVTNSDDATRGRLNEMGAAALVFFDHPLTGVGPDMFNDYYRDYANLIGLHIHNARRAAHCMYLQIAAEHGIPGLLLFLAICWTTIRSLYRNVKQTRSTKDGWMAMAAFLSFLGFLVTGIFLSYSFIRFFWLSLSLSWIAIGIFDSEDAKDETSTTALPAPAT